MAGRRQSYRAVASAALGTRILLLSLLERRSECKRVTDSSVFGENRCENLYLVNLVIRTNPTFSVLVAAVAGADSRNVSEKFGLNVF